MRKRVNDKTITIKRSCILTNNVDPLDPSRTNHTLAILPGLVDEIYKTTNNWIKEGYSDVKLLLLDENKPSFLRYAEMVLGEYKN